MITVGKIAENGETVHQSVVWSRCSANQEIRKSYQKASLELLFLQIWKSKKLEKPYHKASLRLQFLCFQEFNKTQTVKLQCLGISSTLLQKSRMATFIHSFLLKTQFRIDVPEFSVYITHRPEFHSRG